MKQKERENVALITGYYDSRWLRRRGLHAWEFPVVVAEGTARLKSTGNLLLNLKIERWIKKML